MPVIPVDKNELRQQLAQLAYEITNIRIYGTADAIKPFAELPEDYRAAYAEGIWAAIEIARTKGSTIDSDKISLKERDDGYLVYATVLRTKRLHKRLSTYEKFPESVKEEYRNLALKVYEKIDANGGLINRGDTICLQEET